VRVTPVVQQGRPDKKVYTVSDAGRSELARWIAEPLSGRGSSVADNRTRDIAIKVRGADYGDVGVVCALRRPRCGTNAPNCSTRTADSRSGSFPIRAA